MHTKPTRTIIITGAILYCVGLVSLLIFVALTLNSSMTLFSLAFFFIAILLLIIPGALFMKLTLSALKASKHYKELGIRFNEIINNIDEGVIVFNEKGIIEEYNHKATDIFGFSNSETINRNITMLIPFLSRNHDTETLEHYLKIQAMQIINNGPVKIPAFHKSGRQVPIELTLTDMFLDGKLYFVGIMRDISQTLEIESKLKESEEKFRSAFDSTAIGMAIISNDGFFMQANKALCNILGYSEADLLNSNFQSIIISQDLNNAIKMRQELLDNKIAYFQSEERYHHKNGNTVWLALSYSMIRSENNSPLYFVVQVQDITDRKKSAEQLAYQAFYDSLTGLANRSQLEHGINNLINYSKRYHKKFAVFFLDLDKFKNINDTFGHNVGDELLITVAQRLQHTIRKTDIAARLGGDEFVLVMTEVLNFEYISSFAEKLISILCQPIKINGNDHLITTSIGISIYPLDGNDYQTLIKNADYALYQSKEQGRNNYQFCTPEMAKTMRERLSLEHALKAAIIQDEFQLSYQPQIEAQNDNIIGIEAFLRWTSKQIGVVPPQKMLPIAEETGLIVPLTEWIIKTAFQQIRLLNDAGFPQISISINLTARQFMCDELTYWIQSSAESVNIAPSFLNLEVKERLLLQIPETTLQKLQKLRNLGIKIVIDDFGTGYSSLSYLQNAIVDVIKIDDTLIQSIQTNPNTRNMISAIINLAKNLGIQSIAEGVETKEQYLYLKSQRCDIIQGYYISKPFMNADLIQFFKDYQRQRSSEVTT